MVYDRKESCIIDISLYVIWINAMNCLISLTSSHIEMNMFISWFVWVHSFLEVLFTLNFLFLNASYILSGNTIAFAFLEH